MRHLIGAILAKAPVPIPGPGGSIFSGAGMSGGRRTLTESLEMMGKVGTLFNVIDVTAQAVAAVDWHLYRDQPGKKPDELPEVTSHAALDLWNRPNPFWHGELFREGSQQHLDLTGEAWWVLSSETRINGRTFTSPVPLEMWLIRPDKMTPAVAGSTITGYIYHGPAGEKIPLKPEQVIYTRRPNPLDPWRGIGAVQTILSELDSIQYATAWNRNFFLNSAEPGGVIEVPTTLSDPEFKRLESQWRSGHQGVSNAHRVALLEGGQKWVANSVTHREMQFASLRGVMVDAIREAFGFPKNMSGATEDVNRANALAGQAVFAENTVGPALSRWKATLNYQLLPKFGDGILFDHENPEPEDRADEREQLTASSQAAATLVEAGWDPDDVLGVVGLPKMGYSGRAPVETG